MENKKEITKENLVQLMDENSKSIKDLILLVEKNFSEIKKNIDDKFEKIESRQIEIESEQDEIKIKLGQKVHIFDHKDLEFRVEKLEEK